MEKKNTKIKTQNTADNGQYTQPIHTTHISTKPEYTYNYGFLGAWRRANSNLLKADVMKILGTSDYVCFNDWFDGKRPMPMQQVLRFCNAFAISPIVFFFNEGRRPAGCPVPSPRPTDMPSPLGGYSQSKRSGRQNRDPHVDVCVPSAMPADIYPDHIAAPQMEVAETDGTPAAAATGTPTNEGATPAAGAVLSHTIDIAAIERMLRAEIEATLELRIRKELEKEFRDERQAMRDLVKSQSEQITLLSTRLAERPTITVSKGFGYNSSEISIVAETEEEMKK